MTYTKRKRAEQEQATRRRIVDATVQLHRTVGPARTTISAIAETAGVTRLTVYRHFPEETELFAACSAAFTADDPPPAPFDHDELEPALRALYDWYRRQAPMLGNVQRDAPGMPALAAVADPAPYLDAMRDHLLGGRRGKLVRAALGHALAFSTWQSLAGQGLTDAQAARLMAGLAK
jgi:AcrR family transcriptional regulator